MAEPAKLGPLTPESTRWQKILFLANVITDDVYEMIAFKYTPVEEPETGEFRGHFWDFHVDPALLDFQIAYGLVHTIDHYIRRHKQRLGDRVEEIWTDATCIELNLDWSPVMMAEKVMEKLRVEAKKRIPNFDKMPGSAQDKLLEKLWLPPGMNIEDMFNISKPEDAEGIYDKIKDKYKMQDNQAVGLKGQGGSDQGDDKDQKGQGKGQKGKGQGKDQQGPGQGDGEEDGEEQDGPGGGGKSGEDQKKDKEKEGQGAGDQESDQDSPQGQPSKRMSGSPCREDQNEFDMSPGTFEEFMEDIREKLEKGKLAGTQAGDFLRVATVDEPEFVPWQHLALQLVNNRGWDDYSYTPRYRDMTAMGGGFMSKLQIGKPDVGIATDLSGSISPDDLDEIYSLMKGIVCQGYEPQVAGGDTRMTYPEEDQEGNWQELLQMAQANEGMKGGGGTDMGMLAWQAYRRQGEPDTFILITDGETPWPGDDYPIMLEDDDEPHTSLPPGTIIFILNDPDNMEHLIRAVPEDFQGRVVPIPRAMAGRSL